MMGDLENKQLYVFEEIARLIEYPEDHDYQLQDALEQISNSIQQIAAVRATNGQSTYVHFAFADDANGTNFTHTPSNQPYLGVLTDFNQNASDDHNDYIWLRVQGNKGDPGIGQDGIDGKSGLYHSYIYKNTDDRTQPTTPSGGSFNGTQEQIPTGWTDNPQKILGKFTWMSHAVYEDNYDGTWSRLKDWIGPVEWAQDGKYSETRYKKADTKPSKPTVAEPVDWLITPPTVSGDETVWATTTTKQPNGHLEGTWSDPVRWNGEKGQKGDDGKTSYFHIAYADTVNGGGFSLTDNTKPFIGTYVDFNSASSTNPAAYAWRRFTGAEGSPGDDGTLWVYKEDWDSSTPNTAELNSWFVSLAGRQRKNGDVIFLRNHTTDPVDVSAYFVLNGVWTKYTSVINGDMLVDGGIKGRQISSETTIQAGSGSSAVIINGDRKSVV